VAPEPLGGPAISGNPQDGQVLTASTGSWPSPDPLKYTYSWQRCSGANCAPIAGALGKSYKLTHKDVGYTVTVIVTATDKVVKAKRGIWSSPDRLTYAYQ
jgi:hypothetical protein